MWVLNKAMREVEKECMDAYGKFHRFRSPHEGLGIILEEYEELKAEVFRKFDEGSLKAMREEAKHLAAMAIRFMTDLTLEERGEN